MGLRDQFKKGGGGFMNNVDGVITRIAFTTEPDFGSGAQAPKGDGTPLWCELTAQIDGAEKPESTHLFVGMNGDEFVISEDGQTLTPTEDGVGLWGGTAFAQFYDSAVENGLTDVDPAEDGSLNFGHVVGARVRFVQVKDEAAMKRAAKNYRTSKGKINEQGQKKGKDGKYYDIRTLQIEKVYAEGVSVSSAKPKAGATKAAKATATKLAAKTKATAAPDVAEFAQDTLLSVLAKNPDGLPKTKLNLALTRALVSDERRDAVLQYFKNEANIEAMVEAEAITYENGVIAPVEVAA